MFLIDSSVSGNGFRLIGEITHLLHSAHIGKITHAPAFSLRIVCITQRLCSIIESEYDGYQAGIFSYARDVTANRSH
jgi:hypothetical protein